MKILKTVVIISLLIVYISTFDKGSQEQSNEAIKTFQFTIQDLQDNITWLYNRLNTNYWPQNQKYKQFQRWQHLKGLYSSAVHMNNVGKKNSFMKALMRNKFEIDDINMFVTSFVLYGLLEADSLGTIQLDSHRFSESLEAMSKFKDKNVEYGVPQYVFWPQLLINGTWSAQPSNLISLVKSFPQAPGWMYPALNKIGLGILAGFKQYLNVFIIPADNDDSSVNLALLAAMKQSKSPFYNFWNSINYNKLKYYQNALKYAYRPFDSDYPPNSQADSIDPRTYYNYRKFINMKKEQAIKNNQTPTLILPTTWLLNRKQQIKQIILMPFGTNNVDATVCANFIFGLSSLYFADQMVLNEELTQMLLDTTDLLVYVVQELIVSRPDIVLVYYPSRYDFYWFVARIVNLYKRQSFLQYPFSQIYDKLLPLMKGIGTDQILKNKISDGDSVHWVQFLGNFGNKSRNEDSLFSTALALNALIDTWTQKFQGRKIIYDKDIPEKVTTAIKGGVRYLSKSLKKNMKQQNAFFSGSLKTVSTYPYIYPANIHKDSKGKNVDPQTQSGQAIEYFMEYYFKGTVSDSQYQQLLKLKWFGYNVPTKFDDYNQGNGITFPYWSSQGITEIMMITSLSKFMKAEQNQKRLKF